MSVSEDLGQLVLRLSDEALGHATPDKQARNKGKLENYFNAMNRVLFPVEYHSEERMDSATARREFYVKLPEFHRSFCDMMTEINDQNRMSEDTMRLLTTIFGIVTGSIGIYAGLSQSPILGGILTAGMALGTGISYLVQRRATDKSAAFEQSGKNSQSATPHDWFEAFSKNHHELREKAGKYFLYARNGR